MVRQISGRIKWHGSRVGDYFQVWAAAGLVYLVFVGLYFAGNSAALDGDGGGETLVWGSVIYFIAAGGGYRLAMRLGYLVTGEESYDAEVRRSEDRTELHLNDRDPR